MNYTQINTSDVANGRGVRVPLHEANSSVL